MANTYTQVHLHFVFVVKHRDALIQKSWKDELYKYISGIVQHHEHKMICINGMPTMCIYLSACDLLNL